MELNYFVKRRDMENVHDLKKIINVENTTIFNIFFKLFIFMLIYKPAGLPLNSFTIRSCLGLTGS